MTKPGSLSNESLVTNPVVATQVMASGGREGEIHFGFVELLFALAAAEIGEQAAMLVGIGSTQTIPPGVWLSACSHLILAAVVIAASWIGWRHSKSGPSERDITSLFSWDFIELLLDVLLVVFYFILARAVETPDQKTGSFVSSLRAEAIWIAVILTTYVVWDVVSKRSDWERLVSRGWVSLVCALLGWLTVMAIPLESTHAAAVVTGDFALVSLVLLFRALKDNNWKWVRICTAVYVLLLVLSGFLDSRGLPV